MYVTSWFLNDDYEWFFFNVYRVWDLIYFFTFNCGSIYSGIWGKWSAMYTSHFIGIELWFSMWKILLYIETVITYANRLQELHWLYDIHRQSLNFIIIKFQSSLWPILHYLELTKFPRLTDLHFIFWCFIYSTVERSECLWKMRRKNIQLTYLSFVQHLKFWADLL